MRKRRKICNFALQSHTHLLDTQAHIFIYMYTSTYAYILNTYTYKLSCAHLTYMLWKALNVGRFLHNNVKIHFWLNNEEKFVAFHCGPIRWRYLFGYMAKLHICRVYVRKWSLYENKNLIKCLVCFFCLYISTSYNCTFKLSDWNQAFERKNWRLAIE